MNNLNLLGQLTAPTTVGSGDWLGVWVDVNERRPEKMGYVICACEGGNVDKSFYDPTANLAELGLGRKFAGKWGRYFELSKMGYKITHWMPMPKAPNAAMSDADTKP
jgi:hypothetical protein